LDWFYELSPVYQALIATTGTWLVTALGASIVIFTSRVSQAYMDGSLGLAAGVMIAASFWSLLQPSIEMAVQAGYGAYKWVPPVVGFVAGAAFLRVVDRLLPHLHRGLSVAEGPKTAWRRTTLLILAITLHNVPEGLAVGVAFGAAANPALAPPEQMALVGSAIALAVGIGLQNFPEGTAVSLPLRREGMSRLRAFWWGQATALVEPVAGVLGAVVVLVMTPILPYALSFAAGAMIFVVAEELIPESQRNGNVDLATMGVVAGFAIMMVLDVGLSAY
jgi:zinc transporter, ZIP family